MAPYTTPTKKARIIEMKVHGDSNRQIATKFGIDQSTVGRIWRRYQEDQDFYSIGTKMGRPAKLTDKDAKFAALALARGQAKTAADIQREYFPEVHPDTVRNHLRKTGLEAHIKRKVPYLKPQHVQARKTWAAEHSLWDVEDWEVVVFSDESKFNLFGSDGVQWCWRKPGQALDPRYTKKEVKHGGGNLMVWGCITSSGVGRLYRIDGMLNAVQYVKILDNSLLGTLGDRNMATNQIIFQQDGDSKHTSKLAKYWFEKNGVSLLDWPASSPDMNIIENLWGYLDRRVRARRVLPQNLEQLWQVLQEEWYGIEVDYIKALYNSLPTRVWKLVEVKGQFTGY